MRRLCLSAALLSKLAKHLALLACLAIVGESSGRFVMGQTAILFLLVSAALLHSAGRTLQRRLQFRLRGGGESRSRFKVPGSTF